MKRHLLLLVVVLTSLLLTVHLSMAKEFRVGLMPAKESLPFYAEERYGIFKKHGIELVIVPFRSALERDSAYEAGKIDGSISDIVAVALLVKGGRNIKILRTIAKPRKGYPVFTVLKAGRATSSKEIAISFNTVIEYVTDRILEKQNMGGMLKKTEIKSVPLRMQLLTEGKIGYATLAEPLATFAGIKGAERVYTDEGIKGSHVVFVARGDLGDRFLKSLAAAFDEACARANKEKVLLKELLWLKLSLPAELKDAYSLPDLRIKELPAKQDVNDVLSWMQQRGLIRERIPYERLVFR
ncbi:MetQ/NlpA family ABC transporter substrate-binding protein [Syntrophorhabdus aromaticivorans]|uniref:Solute-binding protein family 3/N-terminal domain-containing protein n=1 Tax=Syntrophorhabdus aromaticivorans TaxID=328301 RepID=A0A351TZ31_9BACT|nr:MetQ/NlpA family ABC transporter substrate-binding protein [Syntrophorhabdus aromaticivorans]NLW34618.1 hypothetical protein [Syntrophorhabdus aromaticivorans]HBA52962.1 hypothetical protein [Syntrophorhabdus aromaticivorans]